MASHPRVPITVRIDQFEGPLDLLLHLIQSHELDVSKISISRITDQYLRYVKVMQELNFEFASEFLVMAATLLLWKSRAILPKDGDEEERANSEDGEITPEDLIRQLLDHKRFLQMGEDIGQLPHLDEDVFTRPNQKPPVHKVWREMDISDLALSYQDSLTRSRRRKKVLKKETVSLSDRIQSFSESLTIGEVIELTRLMEEDPDRDEIVVTFLASLELSRLRKLKIYQQEIYDPIYVEMIEKLEQYELSLASGFDIERETQHVESR